MTETGGLCKANFIFRNQPHHSYFDKPFEDPEDCLYLALNEIHPYFLQPKQLEDKRGFAIHAFKDPRTQKSMLQLCYDHTKEIKTKLFRCLKYSKISSHQQTLGVQVMKALQDEEEVEEENLYKWRILENRRLKEKQEFKKFVYEYNHSNQELIYKPTKKLLELYIKWYQEKSKSLILKHPQQSYNTHLGLPQVSLCKDILKDQVITIVNQEIVAKMGKQWIWDTNENVAFKKLQYSIDSYMNEYINSQDINENYENELKLKFSENSEHENLPLWYIPLDSLLFLLTAGDYPDLPTEMLLDIEEGEVNKTIVMNSPLPSRQVGWHIYKQVVEQAALAFLSITKKEKWINYNITKEQTNQEKDDMPEIQANLNESHNYKVSSMTDYLRNCKLRSDKKCKFSKTLIKWQLHSSHSDTTDMQIYTTLTQPALCKTKDSLESSETLGSVSFKLEYKPQFGCEIMTKYEMLEEWFKLKLHQFSKNICLRLDVNNYQTLLQESLTIQKLEQHLSQMYHIDLPNLLTNLFEFLKILLNLPAGHYMLRYNPKFKDNLLLCKPAQEITQNTVHLHKLLQTEPTDLLFMSQPNVLPISENLCSLMHLQHNILPCAFRPSHSREQREKMDNYLKKQPTKKLNDRDWIVKRKEAQEKQQLQNFRLNKKKRQRTRKRERKNAAQNAKIEEQKEKAEIVNEMEIDMILGI